MERITKGTKNMVIMNHVLGFRNVLKKTKHSIYKTVTGVVVPLKYGN